MRDGGQVVNASLNGLARDLRTLPMLRRVSGETIDQLHKSARWVSVEEGEAVVLPGDMLDKVYFVIGGELGFLVYTEEGKVVSLREAGPGSFIGEAALVGGLLAECAVEALAPTMLAVVKASTFLDLLVRDRDLMLSVIGSVVEREKALTEQVVELTTLSVGQRIQSELMRLCRKHVRRDGSASVHPIPTHSDLARRIGTHREAVSRAMSQLQYLGIVVRDGERLFVPDIARLGMRSTSL